ncbi:DUF192 domain-containing protein [Halapricum salinum]|uniref:DUF192 domain-containing protein n=1 Tax=Halapricum salinum TaxID=1457250 RepID=A0A4D6H9U2_9EURY|nr:DUF192 domain-containing protein [Halapricum salinum]QCC50834.1 DUF192 domain-containing protein [Halapricum salinum]
MNRRTYLAAAGAAAAALAGCSTNDSGPTSSRTPTRGDEATHSRTLTVGETTPIHADYETTTVRAVSAAGESLGSVTAAIADTRSLRGTGLSDTERLPPDRGMLFVYGTVSDHVYVMRRMDFGIDIVYADSDRRITAIYHAPEPGPGEDGNDQRYPGRGQYVLEVPYEWTTEHGVSEGDSLEFALPA